MGTIIQKIEQDSEKNNQAEKELKKIKRSIIEICNMLCEDDFDPEQVVLMLHNYVINGNRIMYSYISDYIYALKPQSQGQMVNNIQKLYEYTFTEEYESQINTLVVEEGSKLKFSEIEFAGLTKAIDVEVGKRKQNSEEINHKQVVDKIIQEHYSDKIRKNITKVMDHVNLATYQYVKLNHDDEYFERKIGQYGEKLNSDIDRKINENSKENMNQLISLIGIFTALSFIVFGGVSSLEGLFAQIQKTHTLKLVLVGSLWGLVLFNLLAIFEYFVSRVAGKTFKYTDEPDASFYQKYPLVLIGNTILLTIFLISSWLYFIALEDMGGFYIELIRKMMPEAGIVVVIAIIVAMGFSIHLLRLKKHVDNPKDE